MKYCNECHKLTTGNPLFCTHCGSSYAVKLCSRMHPNPTFAQVCSECGTRDLSRPQPKIPILVQPFVWLLQILPRLLGAVLIIGFLAWTAHRVFTSPNFLPGVVGMMLATTFMYFLWRMLPPWLTGILQWNLRVFSWAFRLVWWVLRFVFFPLKEGTGRKK